MALQGEVSFTWRSVPAAEQLSLIDAGGCLRDYPNTPSQLRLSSCISHFYWCSDVDEASGQIEHNFYSHQKHFISGFFNIKLLRSCQRLHKEGSEFLYGNNTFVFDTESIHHEQHLRKHKSRFQGL